MFSTHRGALSLLFQFPVSESYGHKVSIFISSFPLLGILSSVSSPSSHAQILFKKFMFMSLVAESLSPAGYVNFQLPVPEPHWHAAFLFCHLIANFYFQRLTGTASRSGFSLWFSSRKIMHTEQYVRQLKEITNHAVFYFNFGIYI